MTDPAPAKKSPDLMRDILSDREVRLIARRLGKIMGSMLGEMSSDYRRNIEDSVRFQAVATQVREAREAQAMDLKTAAKALRVPQYRLRYIEECNLRHLRASELHACIEFFGLSRWFARWRRANPKLAARLAADVKAK